MLQSQAGNIIKHEFKGPKSLKFDVNVFNEKPLVKTRGVETCAFLMHMRKAIRK